MTTDTYDLVDEGMSDVAAQMASIADKVAGPAVDAGPGVGDVRGTGGGARAALDLVVGVDPGDVALTEARHRVGDVVHHDQVDPEAQRSGRGGAHRASAIRRRTTGAPRTEAYRLR